MSAPNVSCQRHCEYDYTLIPHSPTYRIKKHELELTGRRGYPVGRFLLELMICLFVIEWPQGCLSSANSGSHLDFFFFCWAEHYRNQDKKAKCRGSSGLQRLMFLSTVVLMLGVKANTGIPFFAFKTVVHQRSQTLKEQHINTSLKKTVYK